MAPLLKLKQSEGQLPKEPVLAPGPSPEAMNAINAIRLISLTCRSKARTDLHQACALLALDKGRVREAYAETLVRCLAQAIGKRPLFFRPGSGELSFDEAWLARLISAAGSGDDESLTFLLRSRVPHHARRNLAFLVRGVAR